MDERQLKRLNEAIGSPPQTDVAASRQRIARWFSETAPVVQWDRMDSPLGPLYVATSAHGLCNLDFGVSQTDFMAHLDPLARTERNPAALAPIVQQLRAYFSGERRRIDVALDLRRLTPFQMSVLQTARQIPAGSMWTYGQVARALERPGASRAVGQALGRNPVPIAIPCHRVVASDGSLGGYSGGGGLESKRFLLALEGAL